MPEHVHPAVYLDESQRGPRPIVGVPTSTAAFLGETERGPLRPRLVTSYDDYMRWFGSVFEHARYMPHAAAGFFENGGKRLYLSRVISKGSTAASKVLADFTVEAIGPGAWGRRVWVRLLPGTAKDENGNSVGFRMQLAYWTQLPPAPFDPFERPADLPRPQYQEDFDDLSVDPLSPDYFAKRLTDAVTKQSVSALASLRPTDENGPSGMPASTAGELLDTGGDDAAPLDAMDFFGEQAGARLELQGISALELEPFREVALMYAPFPPNEPIAIAKALIAHCERMKSRFAVIDCDPNSDPTSLVPRDTIAGVGDSEYAAFYAPWISISDPLSGARTLVPPGGHILGIYARSDTERGVFKAPANEVMRGALNVRFNIDGAHQELLNLRGVNAIRRFPTRGIRVWGTRTLSSNGLWKYVSVRRLFIFMERSIYEGTRWVVFEPNDARLWARVIDTIRLFLQTQWRLGALLGRTEEEAFFITCDRTTMSQDDILNGRLICEIGIAPVHPAEFVIFRIFQSTAEAQQ